MGTRDKVFDTLRINRDRWVSGEELSKGLGLSRAAVWKHVQGLRQDGYAIDSATRKGYRFRGAPPLLLPTEIRGGLGTTVWGQREIIHTFEMDSTNALAKSLAAQGAPEGTLVVAEHQTAGRGRLGRRWHSPPGEGIYVSLIIRPSLSLQEAPKLNMLLAVAAAEAVIGETGLPVRLKWPNDLMIKGRKAGGILIEIGSEMDRVEYAVAGVGLNVLTAKFPGPLDRTATSIFRESGRSISRAGLLRALLGRLEALYDHQKTSGFEKIRRRFIELTGLKGLWLRVEVSGRTISGRVQRIDEFGALVMEDDQGRTTRVVSGDILTAAGSSTGS
jgi:BirA family biotin operon repressor/biotin-[acetyl-CoA-carboxylase] ligase